MYKYQSLQAGELEAFFEAFSSHLSLDFIIAKYLKQEVDDGLMMIAPVASL